MSLNPRILALATAHPPYLVEQDEVLEATRNYLWGPAWRERPELAQRAQELERNFDAAQVQRRYSAVDVPRFYTGPHSTAERMAIYAEEAQKVGKEALGEALAATQPRRSAGDISDLFVVSCTGYVAPGLDTTLARDLGLPRDVRRVSIGHMGCYGAMVGLRQSVTALRAYPQGTVAMLSLELCSLHFKRTEDTQALISFTLFGDGAGAMVLGYDQAATGPEVVDTYCAADFSAADQMSWTVTDEGFVMGLSPRVPVTLRRNIGGVMERLLNPHDLTPSDITHWIIHPGGPSILQVIQRSLELSDEQMAPSWDILRERGNCSSATVLLILDHTLRTRQPKPGEWGVMMAFGPGLTLETSLLRF